MIVSKEDAEAFSLLCVSGYLSSGMSVVPHPICGGPCFPFQFLQ